MVYLKTIYINQNKRITDRRIRKIVKKVSKINKKEDIAIAICKKLSQNKELLQELESKKLIVLNRKVAFQVLAL